MTQTPTTTLEDALRKLFGNIPFKVIIARDHDVSMEVINTARVWTTAEYGTEVATLEAGRVIKTCILGLPITNSLGGVMLPILWENKKCFVSMKHLVEHSGKRNKK